MARFEEGNEIGNRFRTNEEATEAGRKGGIASGEAKRKVKSLKEALNILLEMEHTSKTGEKKTGFEIMAIAAYNKAIKGDTKALKLVAELIDQYKQQTDITSGGKPINISVTDEDARAIMEKIANE